MNCIYAIEISLALSHKSSEPARIRTWNLLIRSQTRYPLRHRSHTAIFGSNFGKAIDLTRYRCSVYVSQLIDIVYIELDNVLNTVFS